jgi:hypothetical protein
MCGRCASVYLYAALYISPDGYGSQFRLAVSAESLHIADSERVPWALPPTAGQTQIS